MWGRQGVVAGCVLADHAAAAFVAWPAAAASGSEARLEIRDSVVNGAWLVTGPDDG